MKYLKIILLVPIFLFVAVMTYRSTFDLYVAYKASDKYVANLCSQSTSTELTCFCYNSYARTCPLEKN